ncbi:MAG: type I restriction enzyme HsdR N-terminal domain-containing protein [Ferruginibacter sp.]
MIKIAYPEYNPVTRKHENKEQVFDPFRKKWVILTPEEWVRQNFMQYLVKVLNYPASLIAIEKEILLNEVKKRFDIVVYDKATRPFMVVECKEMNTQLNERAFLQAIRYNTNMQARYIVITNGSYCFGYKRILNNFIVVESLPVFGK